MQENYKYQVVTFNGDTVIDVGNVSLLSGAEKLQVLTLDEAQAQGWTFDVKPVAKTEAMSNSVQSVLTPLSVNPPLIEEENSSDNLPAIGHLDGFEIQTADDGTLLPSTVNAKMADGSYRRLTLFPQIVDGNVTCMVQFENDVNQAPEEKPKQSSLSEEIDRIICQNENIIAKSCTQPNPLSLLKRPLNNQIKNRSPLKVSKETKYLSNLRNLTTPSLLSRLKVQAASSLSKPLRQAKPRGMNGKSGLDENSLPPVQLHKRNEAAKICVKNRYSSAGSEKNKSEHPLGSSENPIRLLQSGQVYHSQQPLSGTQLRQISTILKSQRNNPSSSTEKTFLFDPETNTKIAYRVVYPDEDEDDDENEEHKKPDEQPKNASKRARPKAQLTSSNVPEISQQPVQGKGDNSDPETQIPPTKVLKIPRTRSGRLSRPPRHIVQDYKRLQTNGEVPGKVAEADLYVDYRGAEEEPHPNKDAPPLFLNNHRRKIKKNFRAEYRCPTCNKIYLGSKMLIHLAKFPNHSNMDSYLEIYERTLNERKARPLNVHKLSKILSGVDKAKYGPLVANAFTLWDFLLLRVSLLHRSGEHEVEALFKELYLVLEKLGRIVEELLIPVYEADEGPAADYVNLDKPRLADALGVPQGMYKINKEHLSLIRLAHEQSPPAPTPVPPQPRPSMLATKFEPNLSTKLMECSNDSIDMDSSSKDAEPEDDKKDWQVVDKLVETNSEFLSEFLQDQGAGDGLALWKANTEVGHVSPPHVLSAQPEEGLSLWKGETPWKNEAVRESRSDLWKPDSGGENALPGWSEERPSESDDWKEGSTTKDGDWTKDTGSEVVWKSSEEVGTAPAPNTLSSIENQWKDQDNSISEVNIENGTSNIWEKATKSELWEGESSEKESKKDWLRQWKEEAGVPGVRAARLTSTPETANAELFSAPLRRNSVSSFAPSHQEEILSLDLHDLFDDLMPEQGKHARPKPSAIESIINEALSVGPPSASLPSSLIPVTLDEVTNLDFLNQD